MSYLDAPSEQNLASATAWMGEMKSVDGVTRLLSERGPRAIAIVLVVALALDCALILTRVLGQDTSVPPADPSAVSAAPQRPPMNPAVQVASIVNGHIFGTAPVATASDGNAPQTSMPLVLAGVIAQKDPNTGQAIIGPSANVGKLYGVGDAIPGGARLHAVYGDRVLLERNGALEALMLPRTAMAGMTPQAPMAPQGNAARNNALLSGLVSMQPAFGAQGKLNGYRIFPGNGPRGPTAFAQLGLKPGDLVTAVNGTPLDDASHAMEIMQTLSSAATATVTVSRNGTAQEVNLNLANISSLESEEGSETPAAPPPVAPPRRRFGTMQAPYSGTLGAGTPQPDNNGSADGNAGSSSDH